MDGREGEERIEKGVEKRDEDGEENKVWKEKRKGRG